MSTDPIRKYLKKIGKKGGEQRAKNLSAKARSTQARKAIATRWVRKRFGASDFKSLALPGAEIVDAGLNDLIEGNQVSVNALAVMELKPKLRFLGVPVPNVSFKNSSARQLLFSAMEAEHGDMAYARFCSLLERLDSFCDALAATTTIPKDSPHRNRRWYA
ncbi:MAG: hypothetical protein H7A33_07935 [Deltaproteobacteria bacterium]|nr:hypothetical protein [Deltaproteobacteria bacterium]